MWEYDYLDKSYKPNTPQNVSIECIVKPTLTILTTDEAKNYIKVSHSVDDSLIRTLIEASESACENIIHKILYNSSYTQKQNGGLEEITLFKTPILTNPTLTYYENFTSAGTILTLNTDYRLVDNKLYHSDNYFIEGRKGDGYKIEYGAGMFTSSVDNNSMEYSCVKTFLARNVAFLYENRQIYCTNFNEENWSISYNYADTPMEIKSILNPLRQPNLGVL